MVQAKILKTEKLINHYFLNKYQSASSEYGRLINKSASCEQVHRSRIDFIKNKKFYPGSDGLIADKKGIITVRTADCLPIFLYAGDKKIILALHAGWRGLLRGIIRNAVNKLSGLGVKKKFLKIAIGPHIGVCCYLVGFDLVKKFKKYFGKDDSYYRKIIDRYFLDLSAIAVSQFKILGISNQNIETINICTRCNADYHSFRATQTPERNFNILMLK